MSNQLNASIIRKRMRDIRVRLSQHVREVKLDAHQLTDWKFYIRRYPTLLLPIVAVLAFAAVPKKNPTAVQLPPNVLASLTAGRREITEPAAERSFLAGIAIAVAGIAMRSATSFALSKTTDAIRHFARTHLASNESLSIRNRESQINDCSK